MILFVYSEVLSPLSPFKVPSILHSAEYLLNQRIKEIAIRAQFTFFPKKAFKKSIRFFSPFQHTRTHKKIS